MAVTVLIDGLSMLRRDSFVTVIIGGYDQRD